MVKQLKSLSRIPGMMVIAFLMSCSNDDGASLTNMLFFEGTNYHIVDGFVHDFGVRDVYSTVTDQKFYQLDFRLFDGEVSAQGNAWTTSREVSFEVHLKLYSPEGSSFQYGTFNFVDRSALEASDVEDNLVFSDASVTVGTNYIVRNVVGGSVEVSDLGDNRYSVWLNLQVEGDRLLTGRYTGNIQYIEID